MELDNEQSKNSYILKKDEGELAAIKEYERLEFQNALPQYDINTELDPEDISFLPKEAKIIDAGLGSGNVSRWINRNSGNRKITINAVDNFKELLSLTSNILKEEGHRNIVTIEDDLLNLSKIPQGSQDACITRYTAQHLPNGLEEYFSSIYRALKPGGRFLIVDADGVSSNLTTEDFDFNREVIDLSFGLPSYYPQISPLIYFYLKKVGFDVDENDIKREVVIFTGNESLTKEREVWEKRFELVSEKIRNKFSTQEKAEEYIERYKSNIVTEGRLIYYVKFRFVGIKR